MDVPWNKRRARNRLGKLGFGGEDARTWTALQERAAFANMFMEDAAGRPWEVRDYQRASLESCADRKVHCDGRDVGKTSEIEILAAWAAATQANSEMLVATQCENHLFPLMQRLARRFQTTQFMETKLVEFKRSPSWIFRFNNGFILWGRIAGPHGMNFQGLHVDWQIVDEAQEMTETGWGELYQALNGDGRRWVYGVPNGLRNTFYRMSQLGRAEHYNWPSMKNPEYSRAKDLELTVLYGGRKSPGYTHRVLGMHGAPAHAVFNLDDYLACVSEAVDFYDCSIGEGDPFSVPGHVMPGDHYLGCDLGYARDPSEFVVYRSDPPHLVNVLRVHLHGVNYARQQEVITELDAAYDFRRIGIDCGNNGRAVAHNLMAQGPEWCDKVAAIEFGANIELEPLPDGRPNRRQAKRFMTELIERRMAERALVFPRSADRESQYASHTYTVGVNGGIVYD
ncbi:MAG: hypothetical protein GY851_03740, partial [bacterium]|nr:hypothetical protein [bacterium]